ncbi:hypothetical protein GH714_007109 [Hevea brasiliensis]|uniref:Ty3-gypsy retrotransposon protein n=1 Tax=Hevea brasiliensis TaxID=3981 RepID=A0A6A6LDD0_HEVBR|nr:hypothetical protein GH714_007109 [Hevea brasiliensis]
MLAVKADEEELGAVEGVGEEVQWDVEKEGKVEISMHALDRSISPNTMKIKGEVDKKSIVILIDSRSTHSFLDYKVARELGCKIVNASPLTITIANGHKMNLKLFFDKEGKSVELIEVTIEGTLKMMSGKQLGRLFKKGIIGILPQLFTLTIVPTSDVEVAPKNVVLHALQNS